MTTELRNRILEYCKEVGWENPTEEDIQKISETYWGKGQAIAIEWNKIVKEIERGFSKVGITINK